MGGPERDASSVHVRQHEELQLPRSSAGQQQRLWSLPTAVCRELPAEPRGALRLPVAFGPLVSAAPSATKARGDPESDRNDPPMSERRNLKP